VQKVQEPIMTLFPKLFVTERPTSLDCDGPALLTLLESLRQRGAVVHRLDVVCNASWRLWLHWPAKPRDHRGEQATMARNVITLQN
jgi:hypothetical protein